MASQTPETPPRYQRARSFLLYAFGISILLHILLGPFFARLKPPELAKEQIEKVSVTKKVVIVVPTPSPPPKPTPPPTPPPKVTPKPPPPAPAAPLKVEPPKTHTQTVQGPSEQVAPPAQGSGNGAPGGTGGGTGAGGNGSGFSTAPPPPPPTKPPCANPNVPPKTLSAYAPDTPDIARQQGITGIVEVKVDLNEKSQILGVTIYRTANALLNKAAMDAAKQSKFQTEIQNCSPIASSYRYIVEFQAE